ncbi:Holliday junction branch migration protein RuvA [Neoehrlichia mikurensis]|uniref:Holliday junction branch migration complex subunit RuvA n=1 Tax=Neoehrlichia mikurensis TaxID=89586 RepID=A0A9Q9BSQ1_9RICK|nr:Holliday junction branch migration protein RuvA [Neoehrlichia mikurensis]QXK91729.1 Holliday junction branch migration protein RuvA [Neoehrlichia mikurensis]QXK92941.1 Holliday junction branch migration protein RuvA [Neoehrlichia mikurensis]QXK93419.1 Holliday junction branch migration protein RuvA [Neoehrlichia mikurensis]UTO55630.1 Holliday junction branch migration protein RuvA [Neoehrlichia mikurensis]UTO56551.1 Holliday junction branch migration protein RuvA [Neoehrlichia mikurensis]
MIGILIGNVEELYNNYIILNVNNVGYIVYLSSKTLQQCIIGHNIKLYIETHINRDNITQLYGFLNIKEQNCIKMLITVNGINYKTALNILDKLTPDQIFSAIINNDKVTLKMGGISEKLVERIITELSAKVSKIKLDSITNKEENNNSLNDMLAALLSLGYDKSKAFNVLQKIHSKFPNYDTQTIIRHALQELSK